MADTSRTGAGTRSRGAHVTCTRNIPVGLDHRLRSPGYITCSFHKALSSMRAFLRKWLERWRARRVSPERAARRVARGAAYLDEVDPTWYRGVDPDTLELSSGSSCILGQLHGEFRLGLRRAHLFHLSSAPRANLSPVSYGFFHVRNVSEELQDRDYDYLNQAWGKEVRARQVRDSGIDGNAPADLERPEPLVPA